MCFYDQYRQACSCFKWGHFRQHCSKEYRTGETCGTKFVMNTEELPEQCKICLKIETKYRSMEKEAAKIKRWQYETGRQRSIEKAEDTIEELEKEVKKLVAERERKRRSTH